MLIKTGFCKLWKWFLHFEAVASLLSWVGVQTSTVLSILASIVIFLDAAVDGLSVTQSIVLSVGTFALIMLIVAVIIWIKQQFSPDKENIGGSLADMDFDEQMDFVHSVVERQVARESAKKPIQPKYDVWDKVDELRVLDAAELWVEEMPSGSNTPTPNAVPIWQAIHNAINAGEIQASRVEGINGISCTKYVSRTELIKFAETRGEKPKFLFPEER
ncbi:MAG: hypothetical protein R8K54_07790 [Mariprofundaceae bacterium]